MPAYSFLMQKLEGIGESNAVDGAVIEVITETLHQRIKFKKDMRPGLLKPLDTELARVAVLVAGKLTSQDHSGHSKGDVDSLCQALSLFPQAEGGPESHSEFGEVAPFKRKSIESKWR